MKTRTTIAVVCFAVLTFGAVLTASAQVASGQATAAKGDSDGPKPLKVFVLAGDENMLEQGRVEGRTAGVHEDFYPNARPTSGEKRKHVNVAVYKGAYSSDIDYDKMKPVATGEVEIGDQRTRQAQIGKRGRVPVPMTPFPEISQKDGYTTVLRGYVSVRYPGKYEFLAGGADAACNVTTVEGREVYRKNGGQEEPEISAVELLPKRRYAFRTIFFYKPGHDFRVPLTNMPGTLTTAVDENARYRFLRDKAGEWVKRDDVVLYDLHPINNNTKAMGRLLKVGEVYRSGGGAFTAVGPELMLGHVLGDQLEERVLLLRFATRHPIWFLRGSRSLGHDYRPPSSGGGADHDGNWDVIHFNWGVWDTAYRHRESTNPGNKDKVNGKITVPIDEYESNLRKLVARMKQTGATLIWATTTPLHEDCVGHFKGDAVKYNAVAEKIMKENGVIIDDLHAESLRQGYPKRPDVHSVGNLAPKVTETILAALADRKNNTKPLPRVLLIGDSITGSYQKQVMKNLDGKAFVCKNPGNGEHTGTGVAKIDEWLDLKRYLLNGQEYPELVDGVKDALKHLKRVDPGYRGQGYELAGFVWFQGIKDGTSPAMAAEYEKNLANLIRDIRKDFEKPNLPVVVAGFGLDDAQMTDNMRKVFEAQMAVGDPEKYPEFDGNVKSVDTSRFCHPDRSPGGRANCYYENAESFLEIGEALGRAMVDLLPHSSQKN